jgi:DNA-directed RNA polymerase specialized sigma24 family protein
MSRSSDAELGETVDGLARRAAEGDRDALTELVREIQYPMYRLALRFLGNPDDRAGRLPGDPDPGRHPPRHLRGPLEVLDLGIHRRGPVAPPHAQAALRVRRARAEEYAAALDAGMGDVDPTLEEAEYRLLSEEVRISCTYGMLLCLPRPQRAAYVLADVLGLTDGEGAEILDCSREAFRQRVSRARRTIRVVIDNRCGLVDPANPCRCGRQIASGEAAGLIDRRRLPLARHPREEARAWIEPVAKQLDMVAAIGDLYRFDRFAAPAQLWDDLQARFPELLNAA